MNRLMWILHSMIATTVMGILITAVLTMNMPGWKPIALAAAVGFVISLPLSWWVARKIQTTIV